MPLRDVSTGPRRCPPGFVALGTALGEHSLLFGPHLAHVLHLNLEFTLISSDHRKQQHFWPFCFLSGLFSRFHIHIYTWSVPAFCFLLFLHLITCCMAGYQKLPCFISESISQPQPQSSPPKEGTSVQVLAHPVCWVTVLNNNITDTLNKTVISMMKIMSTVNCLGPCLLCSPSGSANKGCVALQHCQDINSQAGRWMAGLHCTIKTFPVYPFSKICGL